MLVQQCGCSIAVLSIKSVETSLFDNLDGVHTNERIIVCNKRIRPVCRELPHFQALRHLSNYILALELSDFAVVPCVNRMREKSPKSKICARPVDRQRDQGYG